MVFSNRFVKSRFLYYKDPQTSVPPRVRDGESIGSKKIVQAKGIIALLCDAQGNKAPKFVYELCFF